MPNSMNATLMFRILLGAMMCACAPARVETAPPVNDGPVQQAQLRSGPMLGYSEMREVLLWAQTTASAGVHFVYWDTAAPGTRYRTAGATTRIETVFTTSQIADQVEPGRVYGYEVHVNGVPTRQSYPRRFQTQKLWQWRGDPPAFRIALGSCLYVNEPPYDRPGTPYGSDYEILGAVARSGPDAMVWLGDNTYLREVDWNSRSGVLRRYAHTRALPELQPLLASTHHYATWDDHDFGPDGSDRSWTRKDLSLEAFKLFWGNPTYGVEGKRGVTTMFQWADVDFFLLDDRYYRSPKHQTIGDRAMLGEHQIRWLVDALTSSRAPFKIVVIGTPVLNPSPQFDSYAQFPAEKQMLLDMIAAEKIPGVFFVSGDAHYTALTRIERAGTYPLYDLTVSPLTAGVTADPAPSPAWVEGTLVKKHNFATLDFSGPRTDRSMKISVFDKDAALQWSRTIAARELR